MTDPNKAKSPKRRPDEKKRPADDTAFVVSNSGGVFEHVADDLDDEETESVYLRDIQHD